MTEIPPALKASLEARIREQIDCEVRRDVSALYEFTLPSINASRLARLAFEPEQTLSDIRDFVELVHTAEVESIEVEQFIPSLERHGGHPAAVAITQVKYNSDREANEFRCIWVYESGTWYTTSLGKMAWGPRSGSDSGTPE